MHPRRLALPHLLSAISYLLTLAAPAAPFSTNANRLAYLDEDNPFYPHRDFPKLTTPQWVGEPGIEAVVILAIDDMRDSKKYETYLRPILDRLKRMDGRAPVSIFANIVEPSDPQLQTWLREGLSLEVHTLTHPCPLLQKGSFTNAWNTYHGGVDLLSKVPGNKPVAFRMPCCDSMNSPSPRFYAEIFNRTSPDGNFLQADSSVMCLLTDNFLKRHGASPRPQTPDPRPQTLTDHFRRYFPATTNALTKKSLANFGTYIEDYPYPYVINRTGWEFPAMVPSDWEAFNAHGPTNAATVADWQLALDAVVRAQGVFTFIFHPHGWIRSDQIIQFIDHAERTHEKKVKFLTFKEAVERLNKNLALSPRPSRFRSFSEAKNDDAYRNGFQLLDLNNDGYLDVINTFAIGQPGGKVRAWNPATRGWQTNEVPILSNWGFWDTEAFGVVMAKDFPTSLKRRASNKDTVIAQLGFDGNNWSQRAAFWPLWFENIAQESTNGLHTTFKEPELRELLLRLGPAVGMKLRDFDRDGRCELLVSNDKQNALFAWSDPERSWKKLPYALPPGLALVNERGEDNGLRFVDLNGDGFDDLLLSNEKEYAIYLWATTVKPGLGWTQGWSHKVLHEQRPNAGRADLPVGQNAPTANDAKAAQQRGPTTPAAPIPHSPSPIPSPKEIPPFVRSGPHRNNGAWFHRGQLFVQNEDTAHLPDVVWRKSFSELIAFNVPAPKSPAESQQCFQVRPGFRVELVAAEPLVMSPVAFEWGADGKLWVVEMSDYPNGVPRAGDLQSPSVASEPAARRLQTAGTGTGGGRVKFLEDLDGDGRYDKATVFLDHLPFPTGVMPWRKGVLISAAPDILYAEDTDGDGKADVRKVVFTGFHEGNQQHRVNGFELGLDNWIYGANGDSGGTVRWSGVMEYWSNGAWAPKPNTPPLHHSNAPPVSISGRDFRFRPDTGEFEAIEGQTQFGRRRDDWGNWFGNNNPNWLWHYWLPDRYLRRNPHLAVKSSRQMLANYPDSTRCFPVSTPPIRFNQPQSVGHVTSGCSPAPYRDDLFGPGFATSVFISEPVHNLVHREVLVPDGVSFTSRRAPDEQDREFLASTDNWFRPTMLKTGPDGALYLADFYRFVLEHPEWIAPETQARLDLRAGADKGRIWRVVPVDQPRRPIPNLAKLNTTQLVAALDSPSGWQRDTVQRLLVERQDKASVEGLKKLADEAKEPKVRVQALAVLDGLHQLDEPLLIAAFKDPASVVREHAIRASEPLIRDSGGPRPPRAQVAAPSRQPPARANETNAALAKDAPVPTARAPLAAPGAGAIPSKLAAIATDPDSRVRYQLAFSLGETDSTDAMKALVSLAAGYWDDSRMQAAILSSVAGRESALLGVMLGRKNHGGTSGEFVAQLFANLVTRGDFAALASIVELHPDVVPGTMGFAGEFTAVTAIVDALERNGSSLSKLAATGGPKLTTFVASLSPVFARQRAVAVSDIALLSRPSPPITQQEIIRTRQTAIRLLGRGPSGRAEDLAALTTLLKPQQPAEIQSAAVAQLAKLGGSDSASALLADWKAHSPALREAVLGALLSRPAWIDTLLAALERGQVAPTQISPAQRQKLTTHPQAALRDRATKLFAATSADRAKVIKDYAVVSTLTGSETRGRELFTKNCGVCHKLKGEGREIGPDLGQVTTRDTDWLLTAILDPNAAVEARYLGYTAETKSGREFTGIITAETPNNLVMRGADGTEETILRTDLKQLHGSGLSLMPEGMESALKPQDMADLLAFIRAK